MNKEIWNTLDKTILDQIKEMETLGASVKDILHHLSIKNCDDMLLKFYLEALYGERLAGSIYTTRWSRESEDFKEDILIYLELGAIDVKAKRDIGGELSVENIAIKLELSEIEVDRYLDLCPAEFVATSTESKRGDGRIFTGESYFWLKKEIENTNRE